MNTVSTGEEIWCAVEYGNVIVGDTQYVEKKKYDELLEYKEAYEDLFRLFSKEIHGDATKESYLKCIRDKNDIIRKLKEGK